MKDSDFKFCPRCKYKITDSLDDYRCKNCGAVIYKNSASSSSVLIMEGSKVLLAKRGIEPYKGRWDVVGGFLKYGEHPITGVLREVKEETGLKIKILDFLGIYMDTYGEGGKKTLNIVYIGSIVSGKMKALDDVAELKWFDIKHLSRAAFKSQATVFTDLQKWYLGRGAEN